MDNKTFGIGILGATAVALLIANIYAPSPAVGDTAITNEDFQAVTASTTQGGDALYLLDNNTGKLAVFTADRNSGLTLRSVEDVGKAFDPRNQGDGGK
jgi:hypothetical protein